MKNKHSSPRILFPKTINEALEMTLAEKEAIYWAGGTSISALTTHPEIINLPRVVISLRLVEELTRASRWEHNLEIGAMMSLDQLAAIGKKTLPTALPEALRKIGTRPIRCRGTIGGHLAQTDRVGDLRPLLQILDTTVETRNLKKGSKRRKTLSVGRKFPLGRLHGPEGLQPGELLTRVSIPTDSWDFGSFEKICQQPEGKTLLVFTALARIDKGVLAEWRMALSDGKNTVLRDRELEVGLVGQPLPLSNRELDNVGQAIDKLTAVWGNRIYERSTARNLSVGFLYDSGIGL